MEDVDHVPDDLPDAPKDSDVLVPVNELSNYAYEYIIHVANKMRKASKGALDGYSPYSRYDPISYIKKGSKYCIRVKVGNVLLDVKGKYDFCKASGIKVVPAVSFDAPVEID